MFLKRVLLVALLLVLAVPLVSHAQDTQKPERILYIGTITGEPDIFVGLAMEGADVTLYICDGQPDKATIHYAEWFVGKVADNAIDITAPSGDRVQVTVAEDSATGKFTFKDESSKDFVLNLATDGEAALLRSEFTIDGADFVGGWLILENGDVRGGINKKDNGSIVPASLVGFPTGKRDNGP